MSKNNHHQNENNDGFNLTKEELINCFGSQIASQSSNSNHENENPFDAYNPQQNQNQLKFGQNGDNQKYSGNIFNKDEFLKNFCHGFIDMFFSQKEELREIKDEIKKLRNAFNGGYNEIGPKSKNLSISNQPAIGNRNYPMNDNFNIIFFIIK